MATGGAGTLGRGGMTTKVQAARLAARSGADTLIAHGLTENVIVKIADGEAIGTRFVAPDATQTARKRWLAGHLRVKGYVFLDEGAQRAVTEMGRSLLPVGVNRVEGDFRRGEAVALMDADGQQIGTGLTNYSASEAKVIVGVATADLGQFLEHVGEPELIHRDNLALR